MIVPRSIFSCNGRVTGYLISLDSTDSSEDYASVQVWHPTNSSFYTRVDTECPIPARNITLVTGNDQGHGNDYSLGNVSCTGNNSIEFQLGDVIGYYSVSYKLWSIESNGYNSYHHDTNSLLKTFDITNVDTRNTNKRPLIQVMYGKI